MIGKPPRIILLCWLLVFGCVWHPVNTYSAPLKYTILKKAPHSPTSFTQGLLVDGGLLYESSGLYNRSYIHIYDKNTNIRQQSKHIAPTLFAEGLALFQDKLYLLTWKKGKLLILDKNTLKLLATKRYNGEGWGLTHTGDKFVMSDGSAKLTFRNSSNFSISRTLSVTNNNTAVHKLNELEFAEGVIWANVWQSPYIYKISPISGKTLGIADFSQLMQENNADARFSVLNGIAYDPAEKAFWITGKHWPYRYLVRFTP